MTSFVTIATLTILFFISSTLLPTTNASYNIRDIDGHKVIKNGTYYMRTNKPGLNEGSLTWSYNTSSSEETCPLFITRGDKNTYTPVRVSSFNGHKYIPLGGSIFITFIDNNTPCSNNSLDWSAMAGDFIYVVIGYQESTYDFGSFIIEDSWLKQKYVYKIAFCTDDNGCIDVGWVANGTDPYLAVMPFPYDSIGFEPLYFQFIKA